MKPLYITAVVTYSGKTALALGIGLKLEAAGKRVGYYKPISTQPFMAEGKIVDEDAAFVKRTLKLETPLSDLATVIIDNKVFDSLLAGKETHHFAQEIKDGFTRAGQGTDVLLVEGGASMREGYAIGLNTTSVAELLDMPTLGVVRYRSGLMLLDDVLAMQVRVGKRLLGVVINNVPESAAAEVNDKVVPYLEVHGVKVYGTLPHERQLTAMSVSEAAQVLNARSLTERYTDALIENLSVGAMSVESALPLFRRSLNKAVITGGDRADIQAAALDTSTVALVLTGNLQPNPAIVKRAEEMQVAVLLVPETTIETVEKLEQFTGKTRLSQPGKLSRYQQLLDANLNWSRLFADMGI